MIHNSQTKLTDCLCRYKIKFYSITVLFILAGTFTVAGPKNDRNPANSSINKNAIKLLFVGNSLTYTNNLPDLVEQSGKDSGLYIIAEVLAYPDYALEDHWMDGLVQQRIASGHVDFVVAQQGPSSQQEGRKMLHDYGTKLKNLCDSHNTKLMFLWYGLPSQIIRLLKESLKIIQTLHVPPMPFFAL
jgi:hypothetical protein